MVVKFDKTEIKSKAYSPLLKNRCVSRYTLFTDEKEIATAEFSDVSAQIFINERVITIKPVVQYFTIKHYTIVEEDSIIGTIDRLWWTIISPKIKLKDKQAYKLKKLDNSLTTISKSNTTYQAQVYNKTECIRYAFSKGNYFTDGRYNEQLRNINGEIYLENKSLLVALIGLVLIELMLYKETD